MEILFKDAKYDSTLRQKFLEEIDFGKYKSFIKDVIYFEGDIGDRVMETIPDSCINWLSNTTSIIRVSDYAFNRYSLDEFKNVLIPHEGFHCMQNYFEYDIPAGKGCRINFSNNDYIDFSKKEIIQEIDAHRNQIKHSSFENCSSKFKEYSIGWLKFYENISRL